VVDYLLASGGELYLGWLLFPRHLLSLDRQNGYSNLQLRLLVL